VVGRHSVHNSASTSSLAAVAVAAAYVADVAPMLVFGSPMNSHEDHYP